MKLTTIFWMIAAAAAVQAASLPRLVQDQGRHVLLVDDQPYLMLGVQVHNSSAWPGILASNWKLLKDTHANTVAVPVYWETVEPAPGRFEFGTLDQIIAGARENGLRLALLWFATWKNGTMDYAPEWVKNDPARYPRMRDSAGRSIRVLSPHARTTLEADRRAFQSLMAHLKDVDGERRTVIMVQVENEAGSLGADRDYSPAATAEFNGPVPPVVLKAMDRKPGTWREAFGPQAEEVFAAYHVARYVGQVAEAGKSAYPLPLFVNVWPREQAGFIRPGESHPSGGAVSNLLPLWKTLAPQIDILAPDIYDANAAPYRLLCERYRRADNALLIPETGSDIHHARHMFYALGDYDALGISVFGVDNQNGSGPKKFQHIAASYGLVQPAIAALASIRKAGNLRALVEEEGLANALAEFERFDAVARFGPVRNSYSGQNGIGNPEVTGRVLVGQIAPDEFLVLGCDANVVFRPKLGAAEKNAQILRAEEGYFEDGKWKTVRLLNGDEAYFGLNLRAEGTTVRVKLTKY